MWVGSTGNVFFFYIKIMNKQNKKQKKWYLSNSYSENELSTEFTNFFVLAWQDGKFSNFLIEKCNPVRLTPKQLRNWETANRPKI